jgi:hypothetical protein
MIFVHQNPRNMKKTGFLHGFYPWKSMRYESSRGFYPWKSTYGDKRCKSSLQSIDGMDKYMIFGILWKSTKSWTILRTFFYLQYWELQFSSKGPIILSETKGIVSYVSWSVHATWDASLSQMDDFGGYKYLICIFVRKKTPIKMGWILYPHANVCIQVQGHAMLQVVVEKGTHCRILLPNDKCPIV